MTLLQKLMNNQQKEEDDFKARNLQHGQSLHFNQAQLMIIDPLNKFNNIGKSSYNFAQIQQELRDVHQRLNIEMSNYVRYAKNRVSGDQNRPNLDHVLPDILGIEYQMQHFEEMHVAADPEESKAGDEVGPTPTAKVVKVPSPKSTATTTETPKQEPAPQTTDSPLPPSAGGVSSGKAAKNKKSK